MAIRILLLCPFISDFLHLFHHFFALFFTDDDFCFRILIYFVQIMQFLGLFVVNSGDEYGQYASRTNKKEADRRGSFVERLHKVVLILLILLTLLLFFQFLFLYLLFDFLWVKFVVIVYEFMHSEVIE